VLQFIRSKKVRPGLTKTKIINDPVYGFIKIPSEIVYDLINHPVFQRLRRIKQLGLTYYVYPGAMHTRFQHAIGAAYLMDQAIQSIRLKGIDITDEEAEAALIAILLHDIGHGPFSHALEETIIEGINHENLSEILMKKLNNEFEGKLDLALEIFNNRYHKHFLHQLVSGQLDMDRLDYLRRDSFFTGVTEGIIGSDRIIKMLHVVNDELVVESKGIYSIEKFLIARRLMYWQVYFHKTVIAAEFLLVKILKRAKMLVSEGNELYATPSLDYFLKKTFTAEYLAKNTEEIINHFILLDDDDIMVSAKNWINHSDRVLSYLSGNLINRILPKIKVQKQSFSIDYLKDIREKIGQSLNLTPSEIDYLVFSEEISTGAYSGHENKIRIIYNNGSIEDLATASDIFNMDALLKAEKKYFLSYPKNCGV
jgi:uncharacterized protein